MSQTIKFKRGAKANLPTLIQGEPAFTTDTNDLYVGNGSTNIKMAKDSDINSVYTTTNSGNAYSVTIPNAALTDGRLFVVKFNAASTGAITLNVNSLGAKSVVDYSGNAVTDVRVNLIVNLRYEATSGSFILQGKGGGGGALMGTETLAQDVYVLRNIIPNGSFENLTAGWGGVTLDSVYKKFGTYSSKLVSTATTSAYVASMPVSLISGHIYYASAWFMRTAAIDQPAQFDISSISPEMDFADLNNTTLPAINTWYRLSNIVTAPSTATGYYRYFTYNTGTPIYADGFTLIDLTATYAANSTEPTLAQMNTLMDSLGGYFEGTTLIQAIDYGSYTKDGSTGNSEILIPSSKSNVGPEPQVTAIKALTNMMPNGSFQNGTLSGWGGVINAGTVSVNTSISKFGANSMALVGNVSYNETYLGYSLPYIQGHKYYCSVWTYSTLAGKTSEMYWPEVTPYPNGYLTCTNANTWYQNSFISNNSTIASGTYSFRLDNNNTLSTNTMLFDGIVLIDLTAAYGAGNEPSKTQMDSLINSFGGYFDGTAVVESVPSGVYTMNGTSGTTEVITANSSLIPSNILSSANIMGVQGSIPIRTDEPTSTGAYMYNSNLYFRAPQGYYDGGNLSNVKAAPETVAGVIGLNASKMLADTTVLGVTGTIPFLNGTWGDQWEASGTSVGAYSYGNGATYAYLQVPPGYYLNGVNWISHYEPNLYADRIVSGNTIMGVSGTATASSLGGRRFASGTVNYTIPGWTGSYTNYTSYAYSVDIGFNASIFIHAGLTYSTVAIAGSTNKQAGDGHGDYQNLGVWGNALHWNNQSAYAWTLSGTWYAWE